MKHFILISSLISTTSFFATPVFAAHQMIHFETTLGPIDAELYTEEAPITVANFLNYVDSGFFNQTIFHRVVPGFVVQGGGFTADMTEKPTNAPIKNEANNGLSNLRGTFSMARETAPDTAASEFFINLVDNKRLDQTPGVPGKEGYAVFGKVTAGMDVVDAMAKVATHDVGNDYQNVPVTPIVVLSVVRK